MIELKLIFGIMRTRLKTKNERGCNATRTGGKNIKKTIILNYSRNHKLLLFDSV
jgi:hypothetical protein